MFSPRLFIATFFMVLLMAPMALFLYRPVAEIGGMRTAKSLPPVPRPETAKTVQNLDLQSPIGLLVLDRSGSMEDTDPNFMQSLAAEVFAYFFAHLIHDDVAPASRDQIHFGTILYCALEEGHPRVENRENASVVRWGSANEDWLKLGSAKNFQSDIARNVEEIESTFVELMGDTSDDRRRGQSTPHEIAARVTVDYLNRYQTQYPGSPSFTVFMSDETGLEPFGNQIRSGLANHGSAFVETVTLADKSSAPAMVSQFLEALQLESIDVTSEAKGGGYDFSEMAARPIPIVMRAGRAPTIKTVPGGSVEVRGRDGLYYAVLDPRISPHAAARTLEIDGASEVKLYFRPHWEMEMEPHFYDLLAPEAPPKVHLRYTGDPSRISLAQTQTLAIRPALPSASTITLQGDGTRTWTGTLPTPDAFPPPRRDYELVWNTPSGKAELKTPFVVTRSVLVRFQREDGSLTREILNYPMFSKQKP